LLQYLADAGAVSAELRHQWLVADEPEVHLRVPIVPADAYPFLGDIESVEITGETYPLYPKLALDGPVGLGLDRTALYVSSDAKGATPVSVDEGVKKGRELLQKAKNADSARELTPP
jgi:hypothetical protein